MDSEKKGLFSLEHIRVEFPSAQASEKIVVALDDISVKVIENEMVHLSGPNGSGKSTLLRLLAGLVPNSDGKVYFGSKVVKPHHISKYCAVAMVYQDLDEAIVPLMSVGDHFAYRLFRRHGSRLSFRKARDKGKKYLRERSFLNHLLTRYDDEAAGLSGGWRQLLQLTSALCCSPDLILLDEPTSHLSAEFAQLADDLIVRESVSASVIYVSHSVPNNGLRTKIKSFWRMDNGELFTDGS